MEEIKEQIGKLRAKLQAGDYISTSSGDNTMRECEKILYVIEFCENTGTRLSIILDEIDKVVDNLINLEEMKQKALAAPQLTIKILKLLPFISLSLGFLLGVNTLQVFITPAGIVMAILGGGFAILGNKLISRLINAYDKLGTTNFEENPIIQLCIIKAAVLSGLDLLTALKYLEIKGVESIESDLPFSMCEFPKEFDCLEPSFRCGRSPIGPITAQISNLSATLTRKYKIEGEKLGVSLIVPLGTCYLPSFLFIGVIPVVVALATSM